MKGALMEIADCGSQGIGRIRCDGFGKMEKRSDHLLHLLLAGLPVADHGQLNLGGGVLVNGDATLGGSQHGDAARLPELERAPGVAGKKDLLQAHPLRLVEIGRASCRERV